jgi:hypothetical protein
VNEPSYAALRSYEGCVAALMSDPQVTGDLLLVGLWLARAVHLRRPEPDGDGCWHLSDIAADVFGMSTQPAMFAFGEWHRPQATGPDVHRVVQVLRADIRRYDPRADTGRPRWARTPCAAPMVRRATCGRPSVMGGLLTEVETGRRFDVGACRRHEAWFVAEVRRNREAVAAVAVPRPPANVGGLLAAHIDIDWTALWRVLDPQWTAPPEVDSWAPPKLRLLVSAELTGCAARPANRSPRPRFAVLTGGRTNP